MARRRAIEQIYQLVIRLIGIEPPIWRRILVSESNYSGCVALSSASRNGLEAFTPAPVSGGGNALRGARPGGR